jgi:hypothetical protein
MFNSSLDVSPTIHDTFSGRMSVMYFLHFKRIKLRRSPFHAPLIFLRASQFFLDLTCILTCILTCTLHALALSLSPSHPLSLPLSLCPPSLLGQRLHGIGARTGGAARAARRARVCALRAGAADGCARRAERRGRTRRQCTGIVTQFERERERESERW